MKKLYKIFTITFFLISSYAFSQYYEEQQVINNKYNEIVNSLERKREYEIKSLSADNYIQNKKIIQNKYSNLIRNTYSERDDKILALKKRYEVKAQKEYEQQQINYKKEQELYRNQQIELQKQEEQKAINEKKESIMNYVNSGDSYLQQKKYEYALSEFKRAKIMLDDLGIQNENVEERIILAKENIAIEVRERKERKEKEIEKTRNEYLELAKLELDNKNYEGALRYYNKVQELKKTEDINLKIAQIKKEKETHDNLIKVEAEKKAKRQKTIGTILGVGAAILTGGR